MTMLSDSYFDGSRENFLKKFVSDYTKVKPPILQEVKPFSLIRQKLLIPVEVYDTVLQREPSYIEYLLPWTKDSRIIERKYEYRIRFPLVDGKETEFTNTYNLSFKELSIFWFTRMYTLTPDFVAFDSLIRGGGTSFIMELPPSRESIRDGQLKIVLDAVLAVDALSSTINQKILVIGSASLGISGLAYNVIGYMLTNSEIWLYDPLNVRSDYKFNSNLYHYIDAPYMYDEDCSKYDLVLDDSFIEHSSRQERDPFGIVYKCPNFSIKCFYYEDVPFSANRYVQAFKTEGHEVRIVSRSIDYDFRCIPVGHCSACTELRYLLKGNYSYEFYLNFVESHKVNCMTGEYRDIVDPSPFKYSFTPIQYVPDDFVERCYKLPWDTGIRGNEIPMNHHMISGAVIKISDERFLTGYIYKYAVGILLVQGNYLSFSGDFDRFGLKRFENCDPVMPIVSVTSYNAFQNLQKRYDNNNNEVSLVRSQGSLSKKELKDFKISSTVMKNRKNNKKYERIDREVNN